MASKSATGKDNRISFVSDFRNSINGQLRSTLKTRHSINPATEDSNPDVPVSSAQDVEQAMSAADAAYRRWSQVPWEDRRQCILRFALALEAHTEDFAKLLTMEQGKPVRKAWPATKG